METFGTALVGGLSGLQSMVAGATAGAAAGNLSMGNVSMDQIRLAPNRTSAFMSNWQNDISGNTFSSNMLTGRTAVSLLRNQGYASRVVSMRVSEQFQPSGALDYFLRLRADAIPARARPTMARVLGSGMLSGVSINPRTKPVVASR